MQRASSKPPPKTPAKAAPAEAAPASAAADEGRVHKVRAGETLWSIARAYNTTVEALRTANQFLFNRQLQVGDQLIILAAR